MNESIGLLEKKAYLRILSHLSGADGEVDEDELGELKRVAERLGLELKDRDLGAFDLSALAGRIQNPGLREQLFEEDLPAVVLANGAADVHELAVVKYLAERWQREPPEIEGVVWSDVAAPHALREEIHERSRTRRELGHRGLGERQVTVALASALKIGVVLGLIQGLIDLFRALLASKPAGTLGAGHLGAALIEVIVTALAVTALAFVINLAGGVRLHIKA